MSEAKYLSTTEVAKICSVTPDAVLKWIKNGKITATRTPGGNYRIPQSDIQSLTHSVAPKEKTPNQQDIEYCWEFFSDSKVIPIKCRRCVAYRSKALRCYELSHLSVDSGHMKMNCSTSCDDCKFYQYIQTRS